MSNLNIMYIDLSSDMGTDWDKDVSQAKGSRSIKNSMLGIITSRKGSRAFDPDFGCDLQDEIFENMTPLTQNTLETTIKRAIITYEPRVLSISVTVNPVPDTNSVIITIKFTILDNPDKLELLKFKLRSN